jgi:hypothetical protein
MRDGWLYNTGCVPCYFTGHVSILKIEGEEVEGRREGGEKHALSF